MSDITAHSISKILYWNILFSVRKIFLLAPAFLLINQLSNLGKIPTFPLSLLDFFYISQLPHPLSHCNHHTFKIASAKLCLLFLNNQRNWYLPHGTNCIWSCIVIFLKNNSCAYVPRKYLALCFICSRALVYVRGKKRSLKVLLLCSVPFDFIW